MNDLFKITMGEDNPPTKENIFLKDIGKMA